MAVTSDRVVSVSYIGLNRLYTKEFPIHLYDSRFRPVELRAYTNQDKTLLGTIYRNTIKKAIVGTILERDPVDGIFYGVHTGGPFHSLDEGTNFVIQELTRCQ